MQGTAARSRVPAARFANHTSPSSDTQRLCTQTLHSLGLVACLASGSFLAWGGGGGRWYSVSWEEVGGGWYSVSRGGGGGGWYSVSREEGVAGGTLSPEEVSGGWYSVSQLSVKRRGSQGRALIWPHR